MPDSSRVYEITKRIPRSTTHTLLTVVREIIPTIFEYSRIHQAIIGLTLFTIINNILIVRAVDMPTTALFAVSDPYQIADTVRLLADYTPDLDENPDEIAFILEENINGGYLSPNNIIVAPPSPEIGEEQPENRPKATVEDRKADTKYAVQIGDTISGIGEKFSLKMATIKIKNNISDIDSIKPGQELVIPPADLSEKAVKAAEERKRASAELAESKTKKKIATSSRGNWGLAVPISHNGITRGIGYGHTGIDYRADVGTPVMAADDGVVIIASSSGWNGGYGKTILISHGNGKTTRYGHLNSIAVSPGEHISQGEIIAKSGSTGRSTGPHLHFELRVNGAVKNPF
jgi:murein DD-endopeptidase MepM/ murein hydrolase activator NlpD